METLVRNFYYLQLMSFTGGKLIPGVNDAGHSLTGFFDARNKLIMGTTLPVIYYTFFYIINSFYRQFHYISFK